MRAVDLRDASLLIKVYLIEGEIAEIIKRHPSTRTGGLTLEGFLLFSLGEGLDSADCNVLLQHCVLLSTATRHSILLSERTVSGISKKALPE